MKAITTLAAIGLSLMSASFNPVMAGGHDGGEGSSATSNLVRRDLVGPDFRPATKESIILMREVRRTAKGYEVKVKAANGSLRMKGMFSDEQLTQANGTFSYFLPALLGGSHDLKAGVQLSWEKMEYERIRNGDILLEMRDGIPFQAQKSPIMRRWLHTGRTPHTLPA